MFAGFNSSRTSYYGGNEVIDKLELLCQERALKAFSLDPTVCDSMLSGHLDTAKISSVGQIWGVK
jgi:glycine/serine hydroxymethyltransferase